MRLTKIIVPLAIIVCTGCSDIIVPDISDDQVQLVAPADGLATNVQSHKFFWEPFEDAEEYNLRIVSPSFDSTLTIFLDSTIEGNQVDLVLPYGSYEWNIIALNSAYSSACCQTFRLTIQNDSSANLSNQTILLSAPSDQFNTNDPTINFQWQPLSGAETYLLQVGTPDFSTLSLEKELAMPSYNHTVSNDGQYGWRVRAVNESSLTMTAWKQRLFTLDRTAPSTPELEFPTNGDTLEIATKDPDLFWTSSSDILADTVFIYNNAQRDLLLLEASTTLRELNLDGTPVDQGSPLEDYFWEVISVDKAGNVSGKSPLRRFYAQ
jgi:hypothetical protein